MERAIEIAFITLLIVGILSGRGSQIENTDFSIDPVGHSARQSQLSSDIRVYEDSYSDPSTGYRFYSSDYNQYSQYADPRIGYSFYAQDLEDYNIR